MVKIHPTSESPTQKEYAVKYHVNDHSEGILFGYMIYEGRWLYKPCTGTMYGEWTLKGIMDELAKLNNTTVQ